MSLPSRARRGLRATIAAAGLGLVAAPLALVTAPAAHAADPVEVNILGINDFHGRIRSNGVEAGAAVLAGAVDEIRAAHPHTVFAAAGDLIGASTFESFIAHDKPTIDALDAAGLEVSAVGNHEFDQGYHDLVDRVMAPYDATTNPYGGASWQYIGANVRLKSTGDPAVPETWIKDFGDVQVGFVGAVTEHLTELVSPGGISDIEVTDIVASTNREADELKAAGADLVVLLVHEGAPSTDCAAMDDDPASDFGSIVTGVDDNVDAIVSGHTHLAYACSFPVSGWAGRPVTERPVVSAGQYGYNLNQLTYQVDPATGHPTSLDASILPLTTTAGDPPATTPNYPADPEVQSIVDAAVAQSDVLGAQPLGDLAGPFKRAARPKADNTGFEENRGGESTLGNLVAEAQRWATSSETAGSAQIAFMNPGGLRADMVGNNADGYPAVLTYKQAATVQPFANTLVNMDLTGEKIEAALEQQWQPAGASRPFLRLGTSNGFRYTYDPTAPAGDRITGMWLNGHAIEPTSSYSVTVNSFLSTGGDNFAAFTTGTNRRDTGKTDLQGMVDFMAELAATTPLGVDSRQHAVGVDFPDSAPAAYGLGDTVAFDLSSLAMTGAGDVQDTEVTVKAGDVVLDTAPVDNTVPAGSTNDEAGKASVSFQVPAGLAPGAQTLTVTGDRTGTRVAVPVVLDVPKLDATLTATVAPDHVVVKRTEPRIKVTVMVGDQPATGSVRVFSRGETYVASLVDGRATVRLPAFRSTGEKSVRVKYDGNDTTASASTTVSFRVHAG